MFTNAYFDAASEMRARDTEEQILSILYDFGPLKDHSLLRIKIAFQIFENMRPSY
jgi:hypothetical protein